MTQADLDKYGMEIVRVTTPESRLQVDNGPVQTVGPKTTYKLYERGGYGNVGGFRDITGVDESQLSGYNIKDFNANDFEIGKLNQMGYVGAGTSKANIDWNGVQNLYGQYQVNEREANRTQGQSVQMSNPTGATTQWQLNMANNPTQSGQAQNGSFSVAANQPQPQTAVYKTPSEIQTQMQYKIPGIADAVKVPTNLANPQFVNAIFKEQFGRDATAAEIAKFGQMSVKDAANIVLRERSPFIATGQAKPQFEVKSSSTNLNAGSIGTSPSIDDQKSTLNMAAESSATSMGLQVDNLLKQQAESRQAYLNSLQKSQSEKDIENQILEVRKRIDDTTLNAQAGLNKIEDQAIPMEFIVGQQAGLERQANLKLQTLQANEKNLNSRLGIAQEDRKIQSQGLAALMEFTQQDIQTAYKQRELIMQQEENTFNRAMKLQEGARSNLVMILDRFKGLDLEDITDEARNQLVNLTAQLGIPFDVVAQGMATVKSQVLFDQNLKNRELVAKQASDAFDQQYKVEMLRNAQQEFELAAEKNKIDLLKLERGDPAQKMNAEMALRKEFNDSSIVKSYNTVNKVYKSMEAVFADAQEKLKSGKTVAFDDQALITFFNKMIDENSVVREAEYDRTPAGQGLVDRAKGMVRSLTQGGSGVIDTQSILDAARQIKEVNDSIYYAKADEYQFLAESYDLDPSRVLGDAALGRNRVATPNNTDSQPSWQNQLWNSLSQKKNNALSTRLMSSLGSSYPSGARGGQCGDFAHKIVDFPPVGDSKQEKIASVQKYGIPVREWLSQPKVGDVIITGENPTYGHVAVVNRVYPDGRIRLTESNYKQSEKVSHDRTISVNNPKIYGAIRGTIKRNLA